MMDGLKSLATTEITEGGTADERRWVEWIGWTATGLSVAGVLLNNAMLWPCFLFWMASNAMSAVVHGRSRIWSLLVRDVIFFALAVVGLWQWTR